MTWVHEPDSPWGDVDICQHGCTREHGSEDRVCVYCDWPGNTILDIRKCKSNTTPGCERCYWSYHELTEDGEWTCLRCGKTGGEICEMSRYL